MKCNKCHKIVKSGINKLKQHVTRIRGETTAFALSTNEDKRMHRENLKGIKKWWKREKLIMTFIKKCAFQ